MIALISLPIKAHSAVYVYVAHLIVAQDASLGWAIVALSLYPMLSPNCARHLHFCYHVDNILLTVSILNSKIPTFGPGNCIRSVILRQYRSRALKTQCYVNHTVTLDHAATLEWNLEVLDWAFEVDNEYPLSDGEFLSEESLSTDSGTSCGMEGDFPENADYEDPASQGRADPGPANKTQGESAENESSEYATTPTKNKRKRTKKTKNKNKNPRRATSKEKQPEDTFNDVERLRRAKAREASREEAERTRLLDDGSRALIDTIRKETGNFKLTQTFGCPRQITQECQTDPGLGLAPDLQLLYVRVPETPHPLSPKLVLVPMLPVAAVLAM